MKIDQQVQDAIKALADYAEALGLSLTNMGQPTWLNFGEKVTSRDELLKKLTRKELNEQHDQKFKKISETPAMEMMLIEIQNDLLGGIARDFLDARQGRLHRLHRSAGTAVGAGGGDGVHNKVILQYMELLAGQLAQEGGDE